MEYLEQLKHYRSIIDICIMRKECTKPCFDCKYYGDDCIRMHEYTRQLLEDKYDDLKENGTIFYVKQAEARNNAAKKAQVKK